MAQTVKLIQVFKTADYAVMQRTNGEYVAGWCPRIKLSEEECRDPYGYDEGCNRNMYWAQGHYFSSLNDALIFAMRKEIEASTRALEILGAQLSRLEREVSGNA